MNKEDKRDIHYIIVIVFILFVTICMGCLLGGLYYITLNLNLDSNIRVSMDDDTLESIKIQQEVQETQYKYNCEIKLINQSKDYEQEIFNLILYQRGLKNE